MKNAYLFSFILCMVFSFTYAQDDLHHLDAVHQPHGLNKSLNGFENYNNQQCTYEIKIGNTEIPINTYNGQTPDEHQLDIVRSVIIDDFLVNDDITGGGASQNTPSIVMDGSGNFVFVWTDSRANNYDIYFQRFSSNGEAQGKNTKVNDDYGTESQREPAIAIDVNGNFVIVWEDYRNGNSDIYFQRYNNNGIKRGANNYACDNAGMTFEYEPSIAMDISGNFVIVWTNKFNNNNDIYYQRYKSDGTALGVNSLANDDYGTAHQIRPSIAMDDAGNFIIVWEDYRYTGENDIFYQRYNKYGSKIGTNKIANDDTGTALQGYPNIAVDGKGNFIIAWSDLREGNPDTYFQRYNSGGTAQGINTKVNDDTGTAWQYSPSISINDSGNFVIGWWDKRNGNSDIYFQRFNNIGVKQLNNFKANHDGTSTEQKFPSIAMDSSSNFIIGWEDYRNGITDIYYQRYSNSGWAQGINTIANDDVGTTDQEFPSIAINGSGNFVIAWLDYRNGNYDIYFQRYNSYGIAQGVNTKVGTGTQGHNSIAMDANGNFVIVWTDFRDNNINIYFQRYNSNGTTIGGNTKVNDNLITVDLFSPSIAMDGSGNFVIVWEDKRKGNFDIFYQHFNSEGFALGVNSKANDDSGTTKQEHPSIAMNSSGNFVIVWTDDRNGNSDIYCQSYNSNGAKIGENYRVNDDATSMWQRYPAISMNKGGNFVIAWQDYRKGYWNIYYQSFNISGSIYGDNEKANASGNEEHLYPSIAIDDTDNFVLVWQDYRFGANNPDVIGQRGYAYGGLIEGNYRIVTNGPNNGEQYPVVAAQKNKFVFAWQDNRRSKGWDIYGKIVGWDWDGVTSVTEKELSTSKEFELIWNYPNPFYDMTSFEYMIGNKSNIDISVFDINGKKIRTILKGSQDTGKHTLTWDGKDNNGQKADKGVYFTRFSSSKFQSIIKTVLLK